MELFRNRPASQKKAGRATGGGGYPRACMASKTVKPRKQAAKATTTAAPTGMEAFIRSLAHPREAEIFAIRAILLAADPRIAESIKWNAPSFSTTEHFATFHLRGKSGVQLVLHLGAKPRPDSLVRTSIDEPAAGLEWKGPDRAVLTFTDLADVEARKEPLTRVVRAWIRHLDA